MTTDTRPSVFSCWFCDDCNEYWSIGQGQDGWNGECPSCGAMMARDGDGYCPEDAGDSEDMS